VRRIILGRDPARRFDLDLGAGFPRFVDEFRAERGEEGFVPFIHLVTVAQTVGGDAEAAAKMLRRGGYEGAARDLVELARWLTYARNWAEEWAPESLRLHVLDEEEAHKASTGLDDEQHAYLRAAAERLEDAMDGDAVQDLLYSTAVEGGVKPKKAFAALYTVLLGQKSGPKAGPFVAGLDAGFVRERFSRVSGDTEEPGDRR
jgi:lysyl-tRNA synthetase class 1